MRKPVGQASTAHKQSVQRVMYFKKEKKKKAHGTCSYNKLKYIHVYSYVAEFLLQGIIW